MPTSSEDALRLAVKLAIDEGDLDRASALLDAMRRTARRPAIVRALRPAPAADDASDEGEGTR